jgi:hypothetical protein
MMTSRTRLAALVLGLLAAVPAAYAAAGDPPEAEVQAVLGPDTKVQRTAPGQYRIDGEATDLARLLAQTLPDREKTLKAIVENIDQRLATDTAAASGVSLDTKRAQCQALAVNSIPRTRCYQELEMLRDQSTQSATDAAQQRDDDELEKDKLSRQIDAIEMFEKRYSADGNTTPPANNDKPDLFGVPGH